jgi:hypothetical protein
MEETQATSALPEIAGRWWPCVCGNEKHALFLPANQVPEGRHGTFHDVVGRGQTQVTYWRIHTPRCAKAIGTAPAAAVVKTRRTKTEEPTVIDVRQEGAA